MEKVKVKYSGPGDDDRTMSVSEQEAEDLVNTGLYKKVSAKKSTSDKKESDS